MESRSYRERMARWVEASPTRLAGVLIVLLFAMLLPSVSLQPHLSVLIAVELPLAVLMLLSVAALWPNWRTRCTESLSEHSALALTVASTLIGGVLVALAVLASIVDREAFEALRAAGKAETVVAMPAIIWFLVICGAVWVFVGYGAYVAARWQPLRQLAGTVSYTAALVLPLFAPLLAFHIFQIADAVTAI